MKLSLSWLKEYIDLPKNVTPEQLAHDLTMATVEVEEVIDQAKTYKKMVVGKVKELKKHPGADKLQLVMTDIGGEVKQIVCGGTNLFTGMLVAVALPGAQVCWHGQGELVTLEKTKIRGEESFGMICASSEIGLGDIYPNSDKEILNISSCNKKPGTPLAQALNLTDIILEIDNKSLTNRPDLWSHYGIARELAVIYAINLKPLEKVELKIGKSKQLKVSLKSKYCRRYIGVIVDKVKVGPSPEWMRQRLIAAGMRPVNNIVDLTNYVMLETGEPMHAFDYNNVADATIVVRQANKNEILKTLEGEDRKLEISDLVIADSKKPLALAGIKGGAESGITDQSVKIIVEAANFNPIAIRHTTVRINFRTDGSQRHEKNLDLERPAIGMGRFLYLLKKILPQVEIDKVVDNSQDKTPQIKIKTNRDFIISRLGQDLSSKEIETILERLGFELEVKDDIFQIKVPHWRATGDVSRPEDIVEEVGRIYGYDNLDLRPFQYEVRQAVYQPEQILQKKIKLYLSQTAGLSEVFNYPWAQDRILEILKINTKDLIELAYPPAQDMSFLQNSLVPNLLTKIESNSRFYDELGLFELARVFKVGPIEVLEKQADKLPAQPKYLTFIKTGTTAYLQSKGILEGLLVYLKIANWKFVSEEFDKIDYLNSGTQQHIMVGEEAVGYIGNIKQNLVSELDIQNKKLSIAVVELDLNKLFINMVSQAIFKPLPLYPGIVRDMAFELSKQVRWQDVKNIVLGLDKLIKSVEFLSIYDLGNKKSLAFRVKYGSAVRTLTSSEVEKVEQKIEKFIKEKLKGNLRK